MRYYIRSRENLSRDTFAKVGAMWPGHEETVAFMRMEASWDAIQQRPGPKRAYWMDARNDGTPFASAALAWAAFEASGCGRREDYRLEEAA